MQVVFNAVYERAKATEKKVVFVIDEALPDGRCDFAWLPGDGCSP